MSAPVTISLRPKLFRRLAPVVVAAAAVGGLIAVLAPARAAQIEPAVSLAAPEHLEAPPDTNVPTWSLADQRISRIGFRNGRRHVFDVVPLGPSAIEVEVRTARVFLDMRAVAASDGVDLRLESGFRTVEQQRALFRAWRKGRGNRAAPPGRSNHQSGRALDIVTSAPGARAWLEANAAAFGFKQTVASEPWHWEYVDMPIARGVTKRLSRKRVKQVALGKQAGHGKRPARRR